MFMKAAMPTGASEATSRTSHHCGSCDPSTSRAITARMASALSNGPYAM